MDPVANAVKVKLRRRLLRRRPPPATADPALNAPVAVAATVPSAKSKVAVVPRAPAPVRNPRVEENANATITASVPSLAMALVVDAPKAIVRVKDPLEETASAIPIANVPRDTAADAPRATALARDPLPEIASATITVSAPREAKVVAVVPRVIVPVKDRLVVPASVTAIASAQV